VLLQPFRIASSSAQQQAAALHKLMLIMIHLRGHDLSHADGAGMALCRCEIEPPMRLHAVSRYAATFSIEAT
jgi:hypothetical protein